jgi:hypothetical protein
VSSAADYLRALLDGPMPHEDVFEQVAREVAQLKTHLEDTLADSRKPETGAPCPTCAVQLALDAAVGGPRRRPPRLEKSHGHWCDDPECKRQHDKTGADDRWVCSAGHVFTEAEYRLRIASEYLSRADALTAQNMRTQWGVNPSSLRTWAERGEVHRRGRDPQGRMMYDVVEARRRHDEARGWCDFPRATQLYPRTASVDISSTDA